MICTVDSRWDMLVFQKCNKSFGGMFHKFVTCFTVAVDDEIACETIPRNV